MKISRSQNGIIFEENVKTTNDNRIKLIENTISFFENKKYLTTIDHYEFYLILDEAISNAMEHGNQWNIEKHVTLRVFQPEENKMEISIEDQGNGFNPEIIPEQINGIQAMNPRGRGILIIKKFCDVLWDNNGRIIRMFLLLQS